MGKTKGDVEKEKQASLEKVGMSQNSIKVDWSQKVGKTLEDIKDEEFDGMDFGDDENAKAGNMENIKEEEEESSSKESDQMQMKIEEKSKSPEKTKNDDDNKNDDKKNVEEEDDSYDSDGMQLQD